MYIVQVLIAKVNQEVDRGLLKTMLLSVVRLYERGFSHVYEKISVQIS